MRLKEVRITAGFSQQQVANQLNISQNTYSNWETGRNNIDSDSLSRLSKLFEVSVDYLLGLSDIKTYGLEINNPPFMFSDETETLVYKNHIVPFYENINPEVIAKDKFFALKIINSAMEPRIKTGDFIIAEKVSDINSDEIAVVFINENAVVTRIIKSDTGIMLAPTNPIYRPTFYTNEEILNPPVKILGKVVELRANF